MKLFPDKLILRALGPNEIKDGTALYLLAQPFTMVSAILGPIIVPAGTITDFASIPRAANWYMRDDDPGILFPSVVHDYLYKITGILPDSGVTYSREQADEVLREGMDDCGARKDQIFSVYWAVRLFGGGHWT